MLHGYFRNHQQETEREREGEGETERDREREREFVLTKRSVYRRQYTVEYE